VCYFLLPLAEDDRSWAGGAL